MEWLSWVSPLIAILGVIITAAVGYYRLGQTEKATDKNKADQETKCRECQATRKEQRAMDETKTGQWQTMMSRLMEMHTAQVIANASEHSAINITAARTEEQQKNLLAKMEDLANAVHRIERDMPRDYRPSSETDRHHKG